MDQKKVIVVHMVEKYSLQMNINVSLEMSIYLVRAIKQQGWGANILPLDALIKSVTKRNVCYFFWMSNCSWLCSEGKTGSNWNSLRGRPLHSLIRHSQADDAGGRSIRGLNE